MFEKKATLIVEEKAYRLSDDQTTLLCGTQDADPAVGRVWEAVDRTEWNDEFEAITRSLVQLNRGVLTSADDIHEHVLDVLQDAEEVYGPQGHDYVAMLEDLARTCTERVKAYRESIEAAFIAKSRDAADALEKGYAAGPMKVLAKELRDATNAWTEVMP